MKLARTLLLFLFLVVACPLARAQEGRTITQSGPAPEKWYVSMKKLNGREFELIFHLELEKGWHVFVKSNRLDKAYIAPSFAYDQTSGVNFEGETDSKGIIETRKLDKGGVADIYSYKVVYVQKFNARPNSVISGSYTYQVANDNMARPPEKKTFKFKIK
jgi:hypothetical protein